MLSPRGARIPTRGRIAGLRLRALLLLVGARRRIRRLLLLLLRLRLLLPILRLPLLLLAVRVRRLVGRALVLVQLQVVLAPPPVPVRERAQVVLQVVQEPARPRVVQRNRDEAQEPSRAPAAARRLPRERPHRRSNP